MGSFVLSQKAKRYVGFSSVFTKINAEIKNMTISFRELSDAYSTFRKLAGFGYVGDLDDHTQALIAFEQYLSTNVGDVSNKILITKVRTLNGPYAEVLFKVWKIQNDSEN